MFQKSVTALYLGKEIHAGVSSPTQELCSLQAVGLSQWCLPLRENKYRVGDWVATGNLEVLKSNGWLSAVSDVAAQESGSGRYNLTVFFY